MSLSLCSPSRSSAKDTGRLGRAARFAFGAAVAGSIAVAGCDDGSDRALYGAPPFDAGPEEGGPCDGGTPSDSATPDDGGVMALYGGAPTDGGNRDGSSA